MTGTFRKYDHAAMAADIATDVDAPERVLVVGTPVDTALPAGISQLEDLAERADQPRSKRDTLLARPILSLLDGKESRYAPRRSFRWLSKVDSPTPREASRCFSIFSVGVFGRVSANSTYRGTICRGSRCSQ